MMKKILMIMLFVSHGLASICQVKKVKYPNRVQINVTVDNKMENDTLYLSYYNNYWGPNMGMDESHASRVNSSNLFYFDIKDGDKGAYFYIYKKNQNGVRIIVLPFVLCEKGDEVTLFISKDSTKFSGTRITFSGPSSAKYTCQYEISQITVKNISPSYNYTKKNNDIVVDSIYFSYMPDVLRNNLVRNRIIAKMSLEILENYKPKLSKFIYNLLKIDIVSKEEISNYNRFNYPFTIFSKYKLPTVRKQIEPQLREIYKKRYNVDFTVFQNEYLALSRLYINVMVQTIADTLLSANDAYILFKNSSTGLVRDRIVTAYLKRYYSFNPGLAEQVSDALTYVRTGYCRKILLSFRNQIPGTPAFKFSLPDSSKTIRKLSEFKGKVIIMDFWFTGCAGCASLNEKMTSIREYFKRNEKVVFITVSIDRDRNEWISSLRSGKYTHKGSIDLLADAPGYNSAIVKHYNIIGCPTLILIDPNGKIITGNPPSPPNDEKFIELIENNILN